MSQKFLFFDTETTGKADFRARADAEHQPRLVQIAAILADEQAREVASLNLIVRPHGFEIPAEAAAIHGITTEDARANGVPLLHALLLFCSLTRLADTYVCHNTEFDLLIVHGECHRMVCDLAVKLVHCTMKTMTAVCQLPGARGYKWPTLQEAYRHCFGREFAGAHDALADVRACKDVFFWQRQQNQNRSRDPI